MKLDISKALKFVDKQQFEKFKEEAKVQNTALHQKTGKGSEFLGWVNLPSELSDELLTDIENTAKKIHNSVEVMVVIGIGGSYLGSKAIIEALSGSFENLRIERKYPLVIFAGQNISADYLHELQVLLYKHSYGLTVISKSGTTTEPALAFRVLKKDLEIKYGRKGARKRIIAITDAKKGALKKLANTEGYKTFDIADDIGGRFSVLTPVGLLPIAIAGFDIRELVRGAKKMALETETGNNPAVKYAAIRNALLAKNFDIEILANYNPKLHYIAEWFKQLYGESEGKGGKGIFPASVDFTSDLHSMGQYIQEGRRNLFETVISINKPDNKFKLPTDEANLDGLNYLAGRDLDEVNKNAELGTMLAHIEGGVPNIRIELDTLCEAEIGELIYFFEKACGISGYLLGVNPFDQPGVEAYKKNMFALLEKPGFEGERDKLLKK